MDLHAEGLPLRQIDERLGRGKTTIGNAPTRHGVELRPTVRVRGRYRCPSGMCVQALEAECRSMDAVALVIILRVLQDAYKQSRRRNIVLSHRFDLLYHTIPIHLPSFTRGVKLLDDVALSRNISRVITSAIRGRVHKGILVYEVYSIGYSNDRQ